MCFFKNIEFSKNYIQNNFKNLKYAIGYGSGVIKQKGYNYDLEHPMIDYIFIVDNIKKFHNENYNINSNHYKGFFKFSVNYYINLHKISPIIYYPYIKINDKLNMKYGVISYEDFLIDLNNWNKFLISGRLQKNINTLYKENNKIDDLLFENKKKALLISLLNLKKEKISFKEIFGYLISLSYKGDIRMIFKFENKNKVNNIWNKNLDNLITEYQNVIYHLKDFITIDKENIFIKDYFKLYEYYYLEYNELPIQDFEIKKINTINSSKLLLAQILNNSFKDGFIYLIQKLKKSFKSYN